MPLRPGRPLPPCRSPSPAARRAGRVPGRRGGCRTTSRRANCPHVTRGAAAGDGACALYSWGDVGSVGAGSRRRRRAVRAERRTAAAAVVTTAADRLPRNSGSASRSRTRRSDTETGTARRGLRRAPVPLVLEKGHSGAPVDLESRRRDGRPPLWRPPYRRCDQDSSGPSGLLSRLSAKKCWLPRFPSRVSRTRCSPPDLCAPAV